ncbi:hypothetical protein MNV49_004390 [Pseudohyphozyma bogoriensis]|nr:hypothetical protein MNV49_004390 [Pseudohyphozyma bogoriensis]
MATAEARRAKNRALENEDAASLKLGTTEFFDDQTTIALSINEVNLMLEQLERQADNASIETAFDPPLRQFEIAQLATLCPMESEEAKSLIPSIQEHVDDDRLQHLLNEVAAMRKFQT